VNRVLLLTDGQANVGITEPALVAGLCLGAKHEGSTTTTIGLGAEYDERPLRAMADAGGANSYYIERPDQAPGVFEEELEGLLSLSAQNVAVELRPGDGVALVRIHHDYPAFETPVGCGSSSGISTPGSRGRCRSSSPCRRWGNASPRSDRRRRSGDA
jgi:hypothetical protein